MNVNKQIHFLNFFLKYGLINILVKFVSYFRVLLVTYFIGLTLELDLYFFLQTSIFVFIFALNDINDSIVLKYLNSDLDNFANKTKNILFIGSVLSLLFSFLFVLFIILILPLFKIDSNNSIKLALPITLGLMGQIIFTPIIGLFGALFRVKNNYKYFQNANLIIAFFSVFLFLLSPKNVLWLSVTSSIAYVFASLYLIYNYLKFDLSNYKFSFSDFKYFKSYLLLLPVFYFIGSINFIERGILINYGSGVVSSLGIAVMFLSAPYVFLKLEDTFLPKIIKINNVGNFSLFDSFLKKIVLLTFAYSIFLIFFGTEIIQLLFQYGNFKNKDADQLVILIKMYFFAPVYLTLWPFLYRYSQVIVKPYILYLIILIGVILILIPYLYYNSFELRISILFISFVFLIMIGLSYFSISMVLKKNNLFNFYKFFLFCYLILFLISFYLPEIILNNLFLKIGIFIFFILIIFKKYYIKFTKTFKEINNEL